MSSIVQHQTTNRVLLIRPSSFGFNEQTALSNSHQQPPQDNSPSFLAKISENALQEFIGLKTLLESRGIEVNEEHDRKDVKLPDSVFPNNWLSFHSSGGGGGGPVNIMALYPMNSPSRRLERQDCIVDKWCQKLGAQLVDMSASEKDSEFLEGTGSLVLDRVNHIAYACVSPRTTRSLVEKFCEKFRYKPVIFHTNHSSPEYHTNVVLSIASKFSVICLDSIEDKKEQEFVRETIENSGKVVIVATKQQMNNYVCNCLQLRGNDNKTYLFMSSTAYSALEEWQISEISKFSEIVHAPVDVIERYGGGSVRCMIAEIFPPLD